MKVFVIPASPEQLLNSSSEDVVCVEHPSALAELSPDAVQEFADGPSATCRSPISTRCVCSHCAELFAAGVVYDLVNENALCITNQRVFDGVYSLIR